MRRLPVVALVSSLLAGGGRVATAQHCSGEPAFDGAPARLYANAMFGLAQAYHGGVVVGGSRVFGWAEGGMTTYQRDESGEYALGVGVQLSRRPETRLHICPTVVVGITTASEVGGTGIGPSYLETTVGLGAHAGFVLVRAKSVRVVPTGAFQFVTGRIKFDYVNGATSSRDIDSHGLLTAGVGVGLDKQFTISPSVAVPVGLQDGWVSYVITFSVKLIGLH